MTVEEIVTRKTDKKLEWSFIKSAKILHEDEAFAVVTYRYVIRSRHSNNKASSMWQVCVKARYRGDVEVQEAPALFVVILLVGQIRRNLSVTAVRAQAECLLSRLRNVGSGTGAANRRRQGVVREEVNWARERQAQAVGRRQGRKVVRRGMFLLN